MNAHIRSLWAAAPRFAIRSGETVVELASATLLRLLLVPPAGSRAARAASAAYRLLRVPLVAIHDPAVRYSLDGIPLSLRLSHDLPPIRQSAPLYGVNLQRVTQAVHRKYERLSVIDIGANVGDTLISLRGIGQFPVLCVEGDPAFCQLLVENVRRLGDVTVERTFLAAEPGELRATIRRHRGTAHLDRVLSSRSIPVETLSSVIDRHPSFASAKLVKIDTDGMDMEIVAGARDFIRDARPVLFFEYDPTLATSAGAPPLVVLASLAALGYSWLIAYDNVGEYLVSARLEEARLLEDLHEFASRHSKRYLDLCAFHAEDEDLAWRVRGDEVRSLSSWTSG